MPTYKEVHDRHRQYFTQVPQIKEPEAPNQSASKPSEQAAAATEAEKATSPAEITHCYEFENEETFENYLIGMRRWVFLDTIKLFQNVQSKTAFT